MDLAVAERRREALVEANRQVRVLELLREKQAAAALAAEEAREAKELDEISLVGHVRREEAPT
jgi:flagellar export protein FliJ